ncbi:hypothetical protein CPC08DRAFT_730970 [Agrocybe pediades]|nr:hypothetical protein CPC08DRAFT_730970 [Agrocybe pediades]
MFLEIQTPTSAPKIIDANRMRAYESRYPPSTISFLFTLAQPHLHKHVADILKVHRACEETAYQTGWLHNVRCQGPNTTKTAVKGASRHHEAPLSTGTWLPGVNGAVGTCCPNDDDSNIQPANDTATRTSLSVLIGSRASATCLGKSKQVVECHAEEEIYGQCSPSSVGGRFVVGPHGTEPNDDKALWTMNHECEESWAPWKSDGVRKAEAPIWRREGLKWSGVFQATFRSSVVGQEILYPLHPEIG